MLETFDCQACRTSVASCLQLYLYILSSKVILYNDIRVDIYEYTTTYNFTYVLFKLAVSLSVLFVTMPTWYTIACITYL